MTVWMLILLVIDISIVFLAVRQWIKVGYKRIPDYYEFWLYIHFLATAVGALYGLVCVGEIILSHINFDFIGEFLNKKVF